MDTDHTDPISREELRQRGVKNDGSDIQDPASTTETPTAQNQADGHAQDEHDTPADAGAEAPAANGSRFAGIDRRRG
jgi:hypothetical protein